VVGGVVGGAVGGGLGGDVAGGSVLMGSVLLPPPPPQADARQHHNMAQAAFETVLVLGRRVFMIGLLASGNARRLEPGPLRKPYRSNVAGRPP
jgi:hypothetical protein